MWSLVYLTSTRPTIDHVVHMVSQFVIALSKVHWGVILRILRNLHGTHFHSLVFYSTFSHDLRAYRDADRDINVYDRKSATRYCIFSWKFFDLMEE